MRKDAVQLYAVRKKNGAFIKRGLGLTWTVDLTEVRLYARLRDAQGRITLMRNLGLRKTGFEVVAFALVGPVEVLPAKACSK